MRWRALVALVLALSACTGGSVRPDAGFWPFTPERRGSPQPTGAPVKVGAIFSTTGGIKWLDIPGLNGFRLAADEINSTGGVLGRPIEVVHVDGRSYGPDIAIAVARMIEDGVVALGGVLEPTFGLAPLRGAVRLPGGGLVSFDHSSTVPFAADVAARAGVPLVVAGATAPYPGVFMLSGGSENLIRAAVDHAVDRLGARTAWILADDGYDYTTSMAGAFERRWRARGGRLTGTATFAAGRARHIDEQLAAIRGLDAPPDVVLLAAVPNELGILMDEIRGAGIETPVVTAAAYDSPYIVAFAEERADGLWMSTDASLLDPDPRVQTFRVRYEASFGRPPEHLAAAQGYDTMRLIAWALEQAGGTDESELERALEDTIGFPVLGGVLDYGARSRVPIRDSAIIAARDGALAFVSRIGNSEAPEGSERVP